MVEHEKSHSDMHDNGKSTYLIHILATLHMKMHINLLHITTALQLSMKIFNMKSGQFLRA
jgi:hypothetical protein